MAQKKIINQAAIDAAVRENAAKAQQKAAAESRAAAALEKGRPILTQAISGTKNLAAAVNAQIQALANPGGVYDPISGRVVKTPAQLKSEADTLKAAATGINKYGGLTSEQIELSKIYGKERTDALAEAAGITFDSVPGAIYENETLDSNKRDAFAIIKATLLTYGFTETEIAELNTFIEAGLTDGKMGPEQLKLNMRELPVYKSRFAGNAARVASGLNALSEANYLQQENDYSEIFKMYGVGNLSSRAQFSTLIGNAVSITEATRRIDAAVKRVKNGDPEILKTLKTLYPTITDTDIVSYFLKPAETLPELERKTTVAEIGATAKQFGMKETGLARLEDLQTYGVTLAKAREGYSTIAEELPTAEKLANIYKESNIIYGQTEAEQEQFKDSAEAKRKKEQLIKSEKAQFQSSAGVGAAGLSTTYLRKGSSAGQF